MAVNWTAEQLCAIEERGCNILVAAAAGSGKTAVLVERIIRRICDAESPVPVNRLLVLTFTEAAAAEMKRKIATAMEERLRLEPDNRWLRDQLLMVSSAHISTVHAFCKAMLQNNIHHTNLPVDFTLIDETENTVLLNQALDRVLERYYQRIEKKDAFRELVTGYGGTKTDDTLRETVRKLHHFTRSLAYPEKWLATACKQYRRVEESGVLSDPVWEELLISLCRETIRDGADALEKIWKIVEAEVPADHKYFGYYQELKFQFHSHFKGVLEGTDGLTSVARQIQAFEIPRVPVKTGLEEGTVEQINAIKKQLLTDPMKELNLLLGDLEPERMERVALCSPRIRVLKQLVRQLEREHVAMKRERSSLDFGDLEHEMLGLLSDRRGNPTEVALQLRDRFEEILVDEYQDTNDIQDTIFRLISRDETNIFMVGDLKQSIYRFRNANPNIFAEKYRHYTEGDGGVCIRLFRNFRSRNQVIEGVNGLFDSLMTEETGGIDYTPEEYLIPGATYPETEDNFTTEVLLTDVTAAKAEAGEKEIEATTEQMEAETIAKRIRQMVDGKELQITDKETGTTRPVRLGDITILVRNTKRVPEMERVLNAYGIPTESEVGQQYLDSLEVMTILNFLQIIDNPRQDVPLLAVLRSAMFGFTPEELVKIRLCAKGDFYTALIGAAESGNEKVQAFLNILEDLRQDAVNHGVGHLIFRICHELRYLVLVGAMPGGSVRQKNLKLLYERGEEFEQGTLQGLFHFMAYIESLRNEKADMKAGTDFAEGKNTVSVMTIHKSKGLEFPVVILCNMDAEFNERDTSASVIWHEKAGVAMDYVDTRLRIRYPTLIRKIIREQMIRDSRAEEMRLFYVAATRAKEKLILSTLIGTRYDSWKKSVPIPGEPLSAGTIRRQKSMRDWLLSCLLAHPVGEKLRERAGFDHLHFGGDPRFSVEMTWVCPSGQTVVSAEREEEKKPEEIRGIPGDGEARLSYRYPHRDLGKIPVKLSISELKRRSMPDSDYVKGVLQARDVILSELTEIGAAERGTITHYVMQHMDYKRTETLNDVEQQLEEMVAVGLITSRQKEAVSAEGIYGFFAHPLGQRLKNAPRVEREYDFYMEIPASLLNENLSSKDGEEPVLLQGIADCFFYDGEGVVLIDYKTDRIPPEKAEERGEFYRLQMEYYTKGLAMVLECPVKERYLYFLHCGKAVAI